MAKKEKVPLKQTSDLEAVEQELDAAMADLDGANERVNELLAGVETPVRGADAGDEPEETTASDGEQPAG